uniref:Cupin type-2 domain-containing protein n=1 Tax=Biomphalaria glabrata TaxID=6526 RepID=A0A2C9LJ95_BIOGL
MTDKVNLIKWDQSTDGPLTDTNMRKKLKSKGYTSTMYVFTPGTDFPNHTHSMTKLDAITSGKFLLSMHGQDVIMEPGDIVEVPKNVVHNAHVIGSEDVTFFDSVKI